MAVKSGAGASVSSGASFQARVGAYVLAAAICGVESQLTGKDEIASVSFETTEAVDDINITLADGSCCYVQAKAKIDFATRIEGELRAVLYQFERQSRSATMADRFVLVTSGRSSRRVIFDMRAALEAFRGDEVRFRKDQPRALLEVVDELLGTLGELRKAQALHEDVVVCKDIVRRMYVHVLDLEAGDPIESAIIMVLQSQDFASAAAVWGKMVSDCVSRAKARQTIRVEAASSYYSRFRVVAQAPPPKTSDDLIRVEFGDMDVSVGRELVLGRLALSGDYGSDGNSRLVLMEFYRFDTDCSERIRFVSGRCVLSSGLEIDVIRRTATYAGMVRMMEREPGLAEAKDLTFFPFNSDDDLEVGVCAETHRAKLHRAAIANQRPLYCVHCGRPVSSKTASLIERGGETEELCVGLSHQECLAPEDRVLGGIHGAFLEEHSALVNFDPNAWFKAAHGGQIVFNNLELVRGESPILAWGGRRSAVAPGQYVVEILLQGGGSEIATVRNGVHRFSKPDAEDFAERLNRLIRESSSDPICYANDSRGFGARSFLLPRFGGRERIVPIERARARPYDERFAARYTRPGSWYAPLLFLRSKVSGLPIRVLTSVALFTDPATLGNYLENYRGVGLAIEDYETVGLLSDTEFDDFMVELHEQGVDVVVNPLLAADVSTRLVSGIPIRSIASFAVEQGL